MCVYLDAPQDSSVSFLLVRWARETIGKLAAMAEAEMEAIRHALRLAQERGYSKVELEIDDLEFKAEFDPSSKKKRKKPVTSKTETGAESEGPATVPIKAPLVGYYRATDSVLRPGATVEEGQVVAVVSALGLANDVPSPATGEVVEVLVEDGQPVEFGQPLARVKVL
jgi:acetyl-CoA carboxylase biotin carboxyl carrier protein